MYIGILSRYNRGKDTFDQFFNSFMKNFNKSNKFELSLKQTVLEYLRATIQQKESEINSGSRLHSALSKYDVNVFTNINAHKLKVLNKELKELYNLKYQLIENIEMLKEFEDTIEILD